MKFSSIVRTNVSVRSAPFQSASDRYLTVKLLLPALFAFVIWAIAGEADAHSIDRLLRAAEEAEILGADASRLTTGLSKVLSALPRTARVGMRGLTVESETLVLIDNSGAKLAIGSAASLAGAAALSPDAAKLLRSIDLVIPEEHLGQFEKLLVGVAADSTRTYYALRADGSVVPLRLIATDRGPVLALEASPGLLLDPTGESNGSLTWALSQPIRRHDLRIVSLFDDLDADLLQAFGNEIGELHSPIQSLPNRDLARWIEKQDSKALIVVGHVEGDSFVIRNAAGEATARVEFSVLEDAASEADTTIVYLGCETARRADVSGFLNRANAIRVAHALGMAIQEKSWEAFFASIAHNSGPLLIRQHLANQLRSMFDADQVLTNNEERISRGFSTARMGTLSRDRANELADRLIPGVPSLIPQMYLAGLFIMLPYVRSLWADWHEVWWDAPDPHSERLAYLAAVSARTGAFVLLMPVVTITYLFVMCFGVLALGFILWFEAPAVAILAWYAFRWPRKIRGLSTRAAFGDKLASLLLTALLPFFIVWRSAEDIGFLASTPGWALPLREWLFASVYSMWAAPKAIALLDRRGLTALGMLRGLTMTPVWLIRYGPAWFSRQVARWSGAHLW